MTTDRYKGPRVLPHLRPDQHPRCDYCGRRRRDVIRGVCRVCTARAEADDRHDWERDQWEWEDTHR